MGKRKTPALSVVAARLFPVSVSIKVTVAPGTTALAGSNTVPSSVADTVCAIAHAAAKRSTHTRRAALLLICICIQPTPFVQFSNDEH